MKLILSVLLVHVFSAMLVVGGEEMTLSRLKGPPNSITEKFFKVGLGGIIKVEGEIIRRIILEFEEGKSHARLGVFYKNTTSRAVSPKYTIRFYNPYGILMGGVRVPEDEKAAEAMLEPSGENGKALLPRITRLDSIFRHTNSKAYPKDFFRVSLLSISDSNDMKVEQAGAGQPAIDSKLKPEIGENSKPEAEPASR